MMLIKPQVTGQGHSCHTATVLNQTKTSDVTYLLQNITKLN